MYCRAKCVMASRGFAIYEVDFMKKVYVISAIILALLLTGCEKNTPTEISNIEENPFIQTRAMPDTAHSKALELISERPYSYTGLVEALENSGFARAEASDAADSCGADWDEQALQAAKKELDMYPYSYENLIKNLEEWKDFTHEQAVYAADNCGADWNEQALNRALEILDSGEYGYDYIVDDLSGWYSFTYEQAVYAADNCGADWSELAARCAQDMINDEAYSYEGLIEDLEKWHGFTHEDAVNAADSLSADWAAQSARAAKERIDSEHGYSYLELIGSLEYDLFTHEEAVAAADSCDADWNEQAVLSVKDELRWLHPSRESAKKNLLRDGYTEEQALYGVDNCGADWNDEALQNALGMVESNYAFRKIKSSLESSEFTENEVAYALDNLDFDWNEQALIYAQAMINGETYQDGYSKTSIGDKLAYRGYSDDEIAYALENCTADWNEQALLRTPSYTNGGRTREKTFELMKDYDGFSEEEINYALDNCGVDWDNQLKVCVDSYADIYSRAEIIEKSKYCGHSEEDTARETDSRNINWTERAAARATSALEWSEYSYSGMKKYLENVGFSPEEALFGADNCGADWNEQAAERLEYYIGYFDEMTREEMLYALADDGFTDEEIAYAAEKK